MHLALMEVSYPIDSSCLLVIQSFIITDQLKETQKDKHQEGLNLMRFQFLFLRFNLLASPELFFTRTLNCFDCFFHSTVDPTFSKTFRYDQFHKLLLQLFVSLWLEVLVKFHHQSFGYPDQNYNVLFNFFIVDFIKILILKFFKNYPII